jgi:hypothetical protein
MTDDEDRFDRMDRDGRREAKLARQRRWLEAQPVLLVVLEAMPERRKRRPDGS